MCGADAPPPPPPPPAAPPVLEQQAPKSAGGSDKSPQAKKRKGLSRYKIATSGNTGSTSGLGGISKKTGV